VASPRCPGFGRTTCGRSPHRRNITIIIIIIFIINIIFFSDIYKVDYKMRRVNSFMNQQNERSLEIMAKSRSVGSNPADMALVLPCVRFSGAIVSWHNRQGHCYNFTEELVMEKKMISIEEAINIIHFNINSKQKSVAIQKLNYMSIGKCELYTDKKLDGLTIGVFICKRKIGSKIGYDFAIYKGRINNIENFQFYNLILKLVALIIFLIPMSRILFNFLEIVQPEQILFGALLFALIAGLLFKFLKSNSNSAKISEHEKIVFFKMTASAGLNIDDIIILSRLLATNYLYYDKVKNLIYFCFSKSDSNIS
jgi:hypothetical protein